VERCGADGIARGERRAKRGDRIGTIWMTPAAVDYTLTQITDWNCMRGTYETLKDGWVGLTIAVGTQEIEVLIERLRALKSGEIQHFHFRCDDFSADAGVADVEISLKGENECDNMSVE
jgi:hypothetical protein